MRGVSIAYCEAAVDATRLLVALTGAVPALAAMWVVDRLDRKRPEPARLRHLIAFLGMVSVIPALILELAVTSMFGDDLQPLDLTYQGATFKPNQSCSYS